MHDVSGGMKCFRGWTILPFLFVHDKKVSEQYEKSNIDVKTSSSMACNATQFLRTSLHRATCGSLVSVAGTVIDITSLCSISLSAAEIQTKLGQYLTGGVSRLQHYARWCYRQRWRDL